MSISTQTEFEDHFPITVMVSHHDGLNDLNHALFALIRDLRDKHVDDKQENEALSGNITTYGGYQTSKKMMFLNRPEAEVQSLREQVILPGVTRYLDKAYDGHVDVKRTRLVSWANILSEGDWQAPHMHPTPGNLASGVYYIDVPEKPEPEGCIEFICPHPVAHHHGISLTRRIYPKTGDLILFPPYYIHYVYPFRGKGDRAIVAFDVIKQAMEFVF
jgi:uncharacterized protein (TIGR02466 family)